MLAVKNRKVIQCHNLIESGFGSLKNRLAVNAVSIFKILVAYIGRLVEARLLGGKHKQEG